MHLARVPVRSWRQAAHGVQSSFEVDPIGMYVPSSHTSHDPGPRAPLHPTTTSPGAHCMQSWHSVTVPHPPSVDPVHAPVAAPVRRGLVDQVWAAFGFGDCALHN